MLTYKPISNPKRNSRQDIDALMISLAFRKKARNHKKRHSTNRERSYLARKKAAEAKAKSDANIQKKRNFSSAMRAYFQGIGADLNDCLR